MARPLTVSVLIVGLVVACTFIAGRLVVAAGNSITAPDTLGEVGRYTSLALDSNGFPIMSYYDSTNGDLKLMHCNDLNCAGGDENVSSPDTEGDVGRFSSLALDTKGFPVISYMDDTNAVGDLKVMHCNDPNCVGNDESITSPDTAGYVGQYNSLALDAAGNPVVSYYDLTNGDLKVLHCNDPDCTGGDESIESPDTNSNVGLSSSLGLDAAGNPVVSYQDAANGDLKVIHCNDPDCAGSDESIASPDTGGGDNVGDYTSLELDAAGNPVISYHDDSNNQLKVLHCNDPDCAGGDESIASPDTGGGGNGVGFWTSLELDANGYPVVSYQTSSSPSGFSDLKVMHCNDPDCAGNNESLASPDIGGLVGVYSALALDGLGRPVVSYFDEVNDDLKVLHCGNPTCGKHITHTPTATSTATPTPTDTVTSTPIFATVVSQQTPTLTPPPVGGIALDPNAGALALAAPEPSVDAWPLVEILAGVTAGVLALGGAAWYTRRRRLR